MTTQIWKYTLNGMVNDIQMPMDAEILTVQLQDGQMFNACIWAKVKPENELEKRQFVVIGTGHSFDDTNHKYIGTYQEGFFVWHVFEIVN
jgi:hypothetical protein